MVSWIAPIRKASRIADSTSSAGLAAAPTAPSSAIEIALVGPLMSWRDESKSAPIAVITIAVLRPICAGRPAISA
jgi:hypothetical protein